MPRNSLLDPPGPVNPLLDRIQRNPIGMNSFAPSMTNQSPEFDPLIGFTGGQPVTQSRANALAVNPISGQLNPSGAVVANALMGASSGVVPKAAAGFRSFHGSPHAFDRFSTSKIGTGEGAQVYGHGLYFAEREPVAENYLQGANWKYGGQKAETLYERVNNPALERGLDNEGWSKLNAQRGFWEKVALGRSPRSIIDDAIAYPDEYGAHELAYIKSLKPDKFKRTGGGNMYEVNINAPPERFLDWDKPLSQQHPTVREALGKTGALPDPVEVNAAGYHGMSHNEFKTLTPEYQRELIAKLPEKHPNYAGDPRGSELYDLIKSGDPVASAAALREAGIPGIRYLDQGSRAGSEGTRNTVVFDDSAIEILRKYGLAGLMAGGGAAIAGDAAEQ